MNYFKKLLFGFLFLIAFAAFHYLFFPLFTTYDWVFGFGQEILTLLLTVAFLLMLSSIFFIVFAALSQNFKFGTPIIIIGSGIPLLFSQNTLSLVLVGGYLVALGLFYYLVVKNVNSYITFSPDQLFFAPVKTLTTMLILVVSLGFYLSINSIIKEKGFTFPESIVPDKLIETVIKAQTQQNNQLVKGDKYIAQAITKEQLDLIRQNPELLKQYGITPEILDEAEKRLPELNEQKTIQLNPQPTAGSIEAQLPIQVIKQSVLALLNGLARDYQFMIAPLLALMVWSFFVLANFFLFFLINPILWMIFSVLEKTNFIRFEREMREVKKLIV